jgi:hypothetical protein
MSRPTHWGSDHLTYRVAATNCPAPTPGDISNTGDQGSKYLEVKVGG